MPDVAALVARELDARAAAAEQAEVESFACPVGRGCWRCGLAYCNTRVWRSADFGGAQGIVGDPELVPGWTVKPEGAECQFCRMDPAIDQRVGDVEDDVRVRVVVALLGLPGLPMRALGDAGAFRSCRLWFSEHPDAEPVIEVERRWAHVDLTALKGQFDRIAEGRDEPVREPPIMSTDRCEVCGCRERFVIEHQEMPVNATGPGGSIRSSDWDDTHFVPIAGECVDCAIAWRAQASGRVPEWWVRRRGRRLPHWARQFTEQVPA